MKKQEDSLVVATKEAKTLRIPIHNIPLSSLLDKNGKQKSRKPKGVKLIDLNKDDEVVAIAIHKNRGCDCLKMP